MHANGRSVLVAGADCNIVCRNFEISEIKRLIRQKQRRYNTAKRYRRESDSQNYKEIRTQIHKKLRDEHRKYVVRLLEIDPSDDTNLHTNAKITKRFWSYVKSKRKDASGISVLKRMDGTEATDAQEKATILNDQYQHVFTKEDPSLPALEESDVPTIPKIHVTERGILKQLHALDTTKAAGPDGIPTRVLKETANETAAYLQIIFQQSLDTGSVPTDWKHANITAIYKKGKRDEPSNYRPVSLTSVTCKVLEHIIFHNVMDHLDQHNILVDYQHGFRKNHSCETQLINTLESISRSHDKKKQVDLIVLDFSKAFDTVAHQRLLQKLDQVGIRNTHHANSCDTLACKGECEQRLLTWFKNWLCNRTQKVVLEGQASNVAHVASGVPQGTVLGPLCFLVFINDIGNEISTETSLKLFADDSLIFREIETEEDSKNPTTRPRLSH